MVAADLLEDIVKPLEEYHLSKYHFTWKTLNQYLYHSRLYADKTIYDLITTFIEQVYLEYLINFYFFIFIIEICIDFINSSIICNDFKFDS